MVMRVVLILPHSEPNQKKVGGGLKAMVHLWEIKSGGGLPDEKLERKTMRSTADMKPERVFNTDRK